MQNALEIIQEFEEMFDERKRFENSPFGQLLKAAEDIRNGVSSPSVAEGLRIVKSLNKFGSIDRIIEGQKLAAEYEAAQMRIFSNNKFKYHLEKIITADSKLREIKYNG